MPGAGGVCPRRGQRSAPLPRASLTSGPGCTVARKRTRGILRLTTVRHRATRGPGPSGLSAPRLPAATLPPAPRDLRCKGRGAQTATSRLVRLSGTLRCLGTGAGGSGGTMHCRRKASKPLSTRKRFPLKVTSKQLDQMRSPASPPILRSETGCHPQRTPAAGRVGGALPTVFAAETPTHASPGAIRPLRV